MPGVQGELMRSSAWFTTIGSSQLSVRCHGKLSSLVILGAWKPYFWDLKAFPDSLLSGWGQRWEDGVLGATHQQKSPAFPRSCFVL